MELRVLASPAASGKRTGLRHRDARGGGELSDVEQLWVLRHAAIKHDDAPQRIRYPFFITLLIRTD
jgi:hypothetical protein